ncbi:MAG: redoxin family protein [Nitriliruptorales bacterium]|nr:redoxin family protein [Nitriliruptorales bacterium]
MTEPPDEPTTRRGSGVRTVVLGVAVVALVLLGVAYVAARDRTPDPAVGRSGADAVTLDKRPSPTKAFALPPATLEGFAGGPQVKLTDFRGTPLVVNFWATWCAPCVKEMPDFRAAAAELQGKVVFLGVDVEDAPPNAEPFVERLGIDYALAIDPRREFHRAVGNFGMPTTLLVDEDGIVRYRHTGPLTREELLELLAEHLEVTLQA